MRNNFQSILLIGTGMLNIVIGLCVNILLAKILSPVEYGDFYFIINFYTLCSIIFSFGIFYSCGQLILRSSARIFNRKLYGAMIIFMAVICLIIYAAIYIYYSFDKEGASKNAQSLLIFFAPACGIFLLSQFFEAALPAENKIILLAKTRIYPKIFILICFGILYYLDNNNVNTLKTVLGIYLLISAILFGYLYSSLAPSFAEIRSSLIALSHETKKYGFNVYLGSIFSTGGTSFAAIAVGYFGSSNIEVGFFALATSLCMPILIISASISSANFKRFASQDFLSMRLFLINAGIILLAAIVVSATANQIIAQLWGENFRAAAPFVYSLSIASFFYGISDLVTRYLAAKGHGRELRNSAFLVGSALIFGTIFGVDRYGGIGAAYSRIGAGAIYFLSISFFYLTKIKNSLDK